MRFKQPSLWLGVVYFLILLALALWVRDIPNQLDAWNTTIRQLIERSTMDDPASFATAAIDIAANGWISPANDWIFNLWPPGFMLLEASIITVLGADAPVILILQLLAAGLFSVVLVLLYGILRDRVSVQIAFALPLLIFAFPVARIFLLQPTGISLGESFAIGFFLIFILLSFHAVTLNSTRYAIGAGVCLALSAYFRSQFEIILLALTGWWGLLLIGAYLSGLPKRLDQNLFKSSLRTITLILLLAHALSMPWRAYHWIHNGKPFWVATAHVMLVNAVMSSGYLQKAGAGWIVEGGGNLVCRIESSACGDTGNAKVLFVKTFLANPLEWCLLKFSLIGKYWFSSIQNWTGIGGKSTPMDVFVNGLLLGALVFSTFSLASQRLIAGGAWVLLLWINASLFSAYALIFTFAHFEARYFYFPKIVGMVMLLMAFSQYFRPSHRQDGKAANVEN